MRRRDARLANQGLAKAFNDTPSSTVPFFPVSNVYRKQDERASAFMEFYKALRHLMGIGHSFRHALAVGLNHFTSEYEILWTHHDACL